MRPFRVESLRVDRGQCSRSDSCLDLDAAASSGHWMFDRRDSERSRVFIFLLMQHNEHFFLCPHVI